MYWVVKNGYIENICVFIDVGVDFYRLCCLLVFNGDWNLIVFVIVVINCEEKWYDFIY